MNQCTWSLTLVLFAGCTGSSGMSAAPPVNIGNVAVISNPAPTPLTVASASFLVDGARPSHQVGACTIWPAAAASDGGQATWSPVDAGTLTASTGSQTIVLPFVAHLYDASMNMPAWTNDETLQISASGGTAPAFTATVATPTQIPVDAVGGDFPLDPQLPFGLRWSGRSAGQVTIGFGDSLHGSGLGCSFDAASGQALIPAAVLQELPAGIANSRVVSTAVEKTVTVGDWAMTVEAITDALGSDGNLYGGTADFE